jgi:polysaccharide deacetylase
MLPSHGRFEYSPITGRRDFSWPEDRRLAVYVAVCLEHFSYNEGGLGLSYSPGIPHPNTYNWAWREYGNRVGGWRLLDLLTEHDIAPTVLLNTECYDHCPDLVEAYRAAGAEFVGHGRTNSHHPNEYDETGERLLVRDVYETIARHEGRPPAGWMSPGANPSAVTEDLLAETGYRYTLDWPVDDQPTWMRTRSGPILSVPYPHEVNDVPMIALHHGTASAFADMVIDNVDELLEQSARQPLVCGIVVHSFIVGQPFRLRRFRAAVEHLAGLEGVWLTKPGEIADHYSAVEAPPEGAAVSGMSAAG